MFIVGARSYACGIRITGSVERVVVIYAHDIISNVQGHDRKGEVKSVKFLVRSFVDLTCMGSGIFSQPHREAIHSLDHTGALKLSKVNYVLPCDSNMAMASLFFLEER
jgi:hypothetical protein